MRGWKEEGKWLKAARELDFTPEQRKRVLGARDEALGILHECVSGLLLLVKSAWQPPLQTSLAVPFVRQYIGESEPHAWLAAGCTGSGRRSMRRCCTACSRRCSPPQPAMTAPQLLLR